MNGGVFESDSNSNIKCYNCDFTNNFALFGGVIKLDAEGIFEFYNSTAQSNFALSGAISEVFSSHTDNIWSGNTVSSNFGVTREQILADILTQGYIFDTLVDYVNSNLYLLDSDSTPT